MYMIETYIVVSLLWGLFLKHAEDQQIQSKLFPCCGGYSTLDSDEFKSAFGCFPVMGVILGPDYICLKT